MTSQETSEKEVPFWKTGGKEVLFKIKRKSFSVRTILLKGVWQKGTRRVWEFILLCCFVRLWEGLVLLSDEEKGVSQVVLLVEVNRQRYRSSCSVS